MTPPPKVAFSHDWLNGMRGGEKCLEALCELYPENEIHTLFYEKGKISGQIAGQRIHTSPLQAFPKIFQCYRYYLPFFPRAVEFFRVNGCDLVISTSHCVAKGIRKGPAAKHLCYCFTPMRYAWGFFHDYFGERGPLVKAMIRYFIKKLKQWDLKSNEGVDLFVAISHHVRKRIQDFYARDAEVIYPPVDTEFYTPDPFVKREDFYLIISALVPYKKVDLAVKVFNRLGKPLLIIGDGPERGELERIAHANVKFLGWQSDETLRDFYRRARALVFPGEEDFGIVPVEAQACGTTVIAYGKGGVLETTSPDTAVYFTELSEEALTDAVGRFEARNWDSRAVAQNAARFGRKRFQREMASLVERFMAEGIRAQ